MATRRSTRQSASTAPKYADSSEEEASKHNGKKTAARRKRARTDDADEVEDGASPPKKAAKKQPPKANTKSKVGAKPSKTSSSKLSEPAPTTSGAPAKPPPPTLSPTNRDSSGHQETYWLLKAEPLPRYENGVNVSFSIDDLSRCTVPEPWTGVRNHQARNNMQAMRAGDLGFFYHSNAKPSGVVGVLRVVEEAKVDETAFDKKDPYYDPKSDESNPKWYCVGVEFVEKFDKVVDLQTIKKYAEKGGPLEGMQLITNGRLSVCRVRKSEWEFIMNLAKGEDKIETEEEGNGKAKTKADEDK